jgi:hypothetical protein
MFAKRFLAVTAFAAAAVPALAAGGGPDLGQMTSTRIKTLQLDSSVVKENRPELQKIGGDFADAYRFHNVSIAYAQPDKLHLETVVLNVHISYTINGNRKFTSIPTYHVHKIEDVSGSPGKRQSLLDVGLVPPELFNLFTATYVGKAGTQLIYDIKPKQDRYHDRIYVDPVTHITTRREHYNQDGKLIDYFLYKNPVEPRPRIYVPSRVEVYNPSNKLGAVTDYKNIKINLPVDNAIFDF